MCALALELCGRHHTRGGSAGVGGTGPTSQQPTPFWDPQASTHSSLSVVLVTDTQAAKVMVCGWEAILSNMLKGFWKFLEPIWS